MENGWLMAAWLFIMSLFLLDTQMTLGFVGQHLEPALRQGWAAALLLVPLLTLLLSPVGAWAAVAMAGVALLRLGLHAAGYRRMTAGLVPAPAEAVARIRQLAAEFGLRRPVTVLLDPTDRMEPATTGLLRPVLILTPSVLALPEAEFRAVAAHELAHVWRRDPVRIWACGVARTLLAWHPLARRAANLFVLEVEMTADQQAVRWTGDRRRYALALGRWGLRQAGRTGAAGVVLAGASSHLVHRLTSLTDEAAPAPHLRLPAWLAGDRPERRWMSRLQWFHLALGAGYSLLYLLVTRLA